MEPALRQIHQDPQDCSFSIPGLCVLVVAGELSAAPSKQQEMLQASGRRFARGETGPQQLLLEELRGCLPALC